MTEPIRCAVCGLPFAVADDDPNFVTIAGVGVRGMSQRGLVLRCPNPKCGHVGTWKRGRSDISPLDISDAPVQDSV
jgi:hypothetical protein